MPITALKNTLFIASTLLLTFVSAHKPAYRPESGVIEQCQHPGVDGLFITKEKYPYSNASLACESYGGSLADITNQNYLLGADMVLTCIGPNNKAWIGSWDYKDLNSNPESGIYDCLSLVVGNIGPGGGVDKNCNGILPVLCQNHPTAVQHNSMYSQPSWSKSYGAYHHPPTPDSYVEEANRYPVAYPDLNGGIYRPARIVDYDDYAVTYPDLYNDDYEAQGNPVFYPGPFDGVWENPKYEHKKNKGFYNKGVYKKPNGYTHEGPKGGFPGGIFPGGPGFGSNGYPYGYPYRYNQPYAGGEDCETVTIDGVVTTIPLESVSSATIII